MKYEVTIAAERSRISPLPPLGLRKHLRYLHVEYGLDAQRQIRKYEEARACYGIYRLVPGRRRFLVSTGLVLRCIRWFKENGHTVVVNDLRKFGSRLQGEEHLLTDDILGENLLLQQVKKHPMGQIDVTGLDDAINKIVEILEYFPNARSLVPVSSLRMGEDVITRLRAKGVDCSSQLSVSRLSPHHCAIVTYNRLNGVRKSECDLLLLPDLRGALHDRSAWPIANAVSEGGSGRETDNVVQGEDGEDRLELEDEGIRIYGFREFTRNLTRSEELRLEAICGPPILVRRDERVRASCLWLPTSACRGALARMDDPVEFKNRVYVHNQSRNEMVAAVARDFAECRLGKLKKHGIVIEDHVPQIRGGSRPFVIVLAESKTHAAELKKHLGWYVYSWDGCESHQERRPYGRGIVTMNAAHAIGLNCDVLVVASGEPVGITGSIDREPMLIVDFLDEFSDQARQRSLQRQRSSQTHGWKDLRKAIAQ